MSFTSSAARRPLGGLRGNDVRAPACRTELPGGGGDHGHLRRGDQPADAQEDQGNQYGGGAQERGVGTLIKNSPGRQGSHKTAIQNPSKSRKI